MWVTHADGVAIVANTDAVAAEIHFVDSAGLTIGQKIVPVGDLKQARLADIPAPRRPAKAHGEKFGYR